MKSLEATGILFWHYTDKAELLLVVEVVKEFKGTFWVSTSWLFENKSEGFDLEIKGI